MVAVAYPGESEAYRHARDELLVQEIALRAQVEKVAAMRRNLPDGGLVATYRFQRVDGQPVALADLFTQPNRSLAVYSLMYRPDQATPCPACVSMLDGLDGQVTHLQQHMDFVVVSAATPEQLRDLARDRGWRALSLLSAQGNRYQTDYHAEAPDGSQWPMMNVFTKGTTGVRHFWGSEVFFAGLEGHPRHMDQVWPLWNMLDLTKTGRGNAFPALRYPD